MADILLHLAEDASAVLRLKDVGDGTHALPHYTAASSNLNTGIGIDRSITATTTSQQFMATNSTRRKFYVKNDTATDVWITPVSAAVASAGAGNMKVPANGGYFELDGSSSAWNIIAASGNAAITAREF